MIASERRDMHGDMRLRRKDWLFFVCGVSILSLFAVCHYNVEHFGVTDWLYNRYVPFVLDGNLTSLETTSIPDDGVYFLETSGLPFLNLKQLCSVESAARYHPERPVIVAINSEKLVVNDAVTVLTRHYDNVKFVRLEPAQWLNGTSLSSWIQLGLLAKSSYKVSHMSDVLRLATLYKHGGIYLDMDIIVVRPFDDLKNALGLESSSANGAAMVFDKEHPFIADCINETIHKFDGREWGANGPQLVTRVLQRWCSSPTLRPRVCRGVTLLPVSAFYAIHWPDWKKFFVDDPAESDDVMEQTKGSYGVHMWNMHTAKVPVSLCSRQPFARLAHFHCPHISDHAGAKL